MGQLFRMAAAFRDQFFQQPRDHADGRPTAGGCGSRIRQAGLDQGVELRHRHGTMGGNWRATGGRRSWTELLVVPWCAFAEAGAHLLAPRWSNSPIGYMPEPVLPCQS